MKNDILLSDSLSIGEPLFVIFLYKNNRKQKNENLLSIFTDLSFFWITFGRFNLHKLYLYQNNFYKFIEKWLSTDVIF